MTKIKILGLLIFALSIALAFLSYSINQENKINTHILNTINEQKAFTQEISKNIFYIYNNKNTSSEQLNTSIKMFLSNLSNKHEILEQIDSNEIKKQSDNIVLLWNSFYRYVQEFKNQTKINTPYSNIILEKTIKNIYNTNLKLIVQFEKMIQIHKNYFTQTQEMYKNIQLILFFILVTLLVYLFMQVKNLLLFIQRFLDTSKKILISASVKELKPIPLIQSDNQELLEANNNFNYLVEQINSSVKYSGEALEHSYQSLELVEKNIEDLLKFLSLMNEDKDIDDTINKQENAVIDSLEEITDAIINLKNLKKDLENLISYSSINKS
jgi:hypothetical protein